MEIPMKAKVQCADGPGGQPTRLIVDPANRRITHLVVKERQRPQAERLVPIRYVTDTTGDLICLRCSRRDLSDMRPLVVTEFVWAQMPDRDDGPRQNVDVPYMVPKWVKVKHKSIPRGELGLRCGARVVATDGEVGRVQEFLIDPAECTITHLVLRAGLPWHRDAVTIPITEIDRIEERTVYLSLDKNHVKALPALPVRRKGPRAGKPTAPAPRHR
jgi:sporulation protein YlmC with PRC-barrel domain